jgi:Na+-driven multidrug efflux pump
MAASFSVLNVGLVLILPAIGLGQSALSLLGAALANGNKEYIIKWSKLILHTGVLSVSVLALFVGFAAPWLAQLLLVNRELQQLTIAALPWYAAAMVLEACIMILGRFVLLTGQRKTVLLLMSASQWLVFLPLLYWLSPAYGFMTVWWLHVGYRVVTIFCFWWMWRRFIKGPLIGQMSTFNKE